MTTLAIIAAGNGTRMGEITIPKALYPVNGLPNLQYNLINAKGLFDSIKVFVKPSAKKEFEDFKYQFYVDFEIVPLHSGLGDGHAVLQALHTIGDEDVIIMWGDAHTTSSKVFSELLDVEAESPVIVPCVSEKNPYVTLVTDEDMNIISADFSKLNENHEYGLHDQSLFRVKRHDAIMALSDMHYVLWKNGRYISESHELNFLHSFHYIYNRGFPAYAYITENRVYSYNTVNEVEQIEKEKQ